jgi:cold shock CspA family protein
MSDHVHRGCVKRWLDDGRDYGFIADDDGSDYFVYRRGLIGCDSLLPGQRVTYSVQVDARSKGRLCARNVELAT